MCIGNVCKYVFCYCMFLVPPQTSWLFGGVGEGAVKGVKALSAVCLPCGGSGKVALPSPVTSFEILNLFLFFSRFLSAKIKTLILNDLELKAV